jgi:hypothetical protein
VLTQTISKCRDGKNDRQKRLQIQQQGKRLANGALAPKRIADASAQTAPAIGR